MDKKHLNIPPQGGEPLEKNVKGALAGIGLATAAITGHALFNKPVAQEHPAIKITQQEKPTKTTSSASKVLEQVTEPVVAKKQPATKESPYSEWHHETNPKINLGGLHNDLQVLAEIESRSGKSMKHQMHSSGHPFKTAFGPVGFKPMSAFEEYSKTPHLREIYPEYAEKTVPEKDRQIAFNKEFQTNPDFHNTIANSHWNTLLTKFDNKPEVAAFAWRFGRKAAIDALDADKKQKDLTKKIIPNSGYVKTFLKGREAAAEKAKTETVKAPLGKNEQPHVPFEQTKSFKQIKPSGQKDENTFDYSHLLKDSHRQAGYSLHVGPSDAFPNAKFVEAKIMHKDPADPNAKPVKVGYTFAQLDSKNPKRATLFAANIEDKKHREKGLGKRAYAALYGHLYNMGRKKVDGGVHSTFAALAQMSIHDQFNTGYDPDANIGPESPYPDEKSWVAAKPKDFDDKYAPYSITLKMEQGV